MIEKDDESDGSIKESLQDAYEYITAHYDELRGESARAATILAVTSLEDEMKMLVLKRFPGEISEAAIDGLFGVDRPLNTYSAKNAVCFAFGFYGEKTKSLISKIAYVRNVFAHEKDARSFAHPEVFKCCKKLCSNEVFSFPCDEKSQPEDIRRNFIHLVSSMERLLAARREHIAELDAPLVPLP